MRKTFPHSFYIIQAIAKVTFQEILRDRVLVNILFCSVLLVIFSSLASQVMVQQTPRILIDFGLLSITISCAMISIFNGASLLPKEFERRTIYVTLCHPIRKIHFICGKFFGLLAVIALNGILFFSILVNLLYFESTDHILISSTLIGAFFLILIQSAVLAAMSLFFSISFSPSVTVMCTLGSFILGMSLSNMSLLIEKSNATHLKFVYECISYLIPHFELFNLSEKVSYATPISFIQFLGGIFHGIFWCTAILSLSQISLERKEI